MYMSHRVRSLCHTGSQPFVTQDRNLYHTGPQPLLVSDQGAGGLAWMRTGSAVVERSTPTVALSLLNHGPEALTTTLALIALPSSMVTPVTWGRGGGGGRG